MPSVPRLARHIAVVEAINRTGRLVASFSLDADGRTIGAPSTHNRRSRCSGCDTEGHTLERCQGAGNPPRPTYQERRVAQRIEKLRRKADYDLDEARAEIARRIAAKGRK